jgi:hypothetical protein
LWRRTTPGGPDDPPTTPPAIHSTTLKHREKEEFRKQISLPGLDKDPSEQVLDAGDGGGGIDAESLSSFWKQEELIAFSLN